MSFNTIRSIRNKQFVSKRLKMADDHSLISFTQTIKLKFQDEDESLSYQPTQFHTCRPNLFEDSKMVQNSQIDQQLISLEEVEKTTIQKPNRIQKVKIPYPLASYKSIQSRRAKTKEQNLKELGIKRKSIMCRTIGSEMRKNEQNHSLTQKTIKIVKQDEENTIKKVIPTMLLRRKQLYRRQAKQLNLLSTVERKITNRKISQKIQPWQLDYLPSPY